MGSEKDTWVKCFLGEVLVNCTHHITNTGLATLLISKQRRLLLPVLYVEMESESKYLFLSGFFNFFLIGFIHIVG